MQRSPWGQRFRVRPWLRSVALVAVFGIAAALSALFAPPPATISGHAEIVDGDTLRIGGSRIRLIGLDAPELAQTCTDPSGVTWDCGKRAKAFVVGLVEHRSVTCLSSGRDTYGRALAKCDAGAGDLGTAIVAAGWAIGEFAYVSEATNAQSQRLGIWAGTFLLPAEWRRSHGEGNRSLWDQITSWF